MASFDYDALGQRIRKVDYNTAANTRIYYYNDNWQVLAEYDGSVVERYEYNAYGKATVYNADYTQSWQKPQTANPYLYTGRRLDILDGGSLKLQYSRHRYYDAQTGRFLQKDPLGLVGYTGNEEKYSPLTQYTDGLNVYDFAKSNALSRLDPYGLCSYEFISPGSYRKVDCHDIMCPSSEDYVEPPSSPEPQPTPPTGGSCQFREYRNTVLVGANIPHAGILVGLSNDIDFGPAVKSPIMTGVCPFSGGGPKWGQTVTHDLEIKTTGKFKYGKSKGKNCKCATCGDVRSCLNSICADWNGSLYSLIGHNCQTFARKAKDACCLKRQ